MVSNGPETPARSPQYPEAPRCFWSVEEQAALGVHAIRPPGRHPGSTVYAARAASGLIKLGTTNNIGTRVALLRTSAPEGIDLLAWTRGGRHEEIFVMSLVVGSLHHGEWFLPTLEVLALVANLGRIVRRQNARSNYLDTRWRWSRGHHATLTAGRRARAASPLPPLVITARLAVSP